MPINYSIQDNGTFVHTMCTGMITPEEVLKYRSELSLSKDVADGFDELFDVTQITDSRITPEDMIHFAKLVKKSNKISPFSKLAIVTSNTNSFNKARLYEKEVKMAHNVIIFSNMDVARIWLGRE